MRLNAATSQINPIGKSIIIEEFGTDAPLVTVILVIPAVITFSEKYDHEE